jgi:hypothetical protein
VEREILSVVWNKDTHFIDLAYADQPTDSLIGKQEMAAQLADEAGLALVSATEGRPTGPRRFKGPIRTPILC